VQEEGATAPSGRFFEFSTGYLYLPIHPILPQIPVIPTLLSYFVRISVTKLVALFPQATICFTGISAIVDCIYYPDFYITRNTFSKIVQKIASRS
jgi:hypothetical protein